MAWRQSVSFPKSSRWSLRMYVNTSGTLFVVNTRFVGSYVSLKPSRVRHVIYLSVQSLLIWITVRSLDVSIVISVFSVIMRTSCIRCDIVKSIWPWWKLSKLKKSFNCLWHIIVFNRRKMMKNLIYMYMHNEKIINKMK